MSIRRQAHLWPIRVPTDGIMHQIRQIATCIYDGGPEDDFPGMMAIYTTNIYKRPIPDPELKTLFPAAYDIHLNRLLARLRVFLFVHDFINDGRMHEISNRDAILKHLRNYVHYTDSVLDAIFDEAENDNSLGPDWRSSVLDKWLVYDYHVGGHTTHDIELFLIEHNEDQLAEDPMEFDWEEWEDSMPEWYLVPSYFSLEGQWPGRQIVVAREVVDWIQNSLDVVEEVESKSKGHVTLQMEQSSTRKSGRLASKDGTVGIARANTMQASTSSNVGKGKGKSKSKIVSKSKVQDSEDDGEVSGRTGGSDKKKEKRRTIDRATTRANKNERNFAVGDGDKGFAMNPLVKDLRAKEKDQKEKQKQKTDSVEIAKDEQERNNMALERREAAAVAKALEDERKKEEEAAKAMALEDQKAKEEAARAKALEETKYQQEEAAKSKALEEEIKKGDEEGDNKQNMVTDNDSQHQQVADADAIEKKAKKAHGAIKARDQANALKRRRESSDGGGESSSSSNVRRSGRRQDSRYTTPGSVPDGDLDPVPTWPNLSDPKSWTPGVPNENPFGNPPGTVLVNPRRNPSRGGSTSKS